MIKFWVRACKKAVNQGFIKPAVLCWQWLLQRSEKLLVNSASSIGTAGKPIKGQLPIDSLSAADLEWAVGSVCNLNAAPFELSLFRERFAPPHHLGSLIEALEALGFKPRYEEAQGVDGLQAHLPLLVTLNPQSDMFGDGQKPSTGLETPRLGILARIDEERVVLFVAGSNTPQVLSMAEFLGLFRGQVIHFEKAEPVATDPDGQASASKFGFGWFVPELLKHRAVWRDVIVASLLMQLISLAMPLASQVLMDKVIVHRTLNTLWVVAAALAICIIFTGIMTWVRQYLINHTGNRVDATLGAAVFHRLVSLPVRYFEQRPTGVIAARLHGVETIREFIASAAITLILDMPFLVIFIGLMFYYNVMLTLITLATIGVIVVLSFIVAPIFQKMLNEQFLIGATNQAFLTEYVSGMETVKSLQMESRLGGRYESLLASYLAAGFKTKQLANTYNTAVTTLEQIMSSTILVIGAWVVMNSTEFTIGMLVAFQMFASRVSQPMLRLAGLWQQLQQAKIAVDRLADIMDVPTEPYAIAPRRTGSGPGKIELIDLGFRYAQDRPWLYRNLNVKIETGKVTLIVGPSGSGKSTLTKLLQGFYMPSEGRILMDGRDHSTQYANEVRRMFGIVPQETVLFSGSVYDNLTAGNAMTTFDQVVQASKLAEIHDVIEALPQGYQTLLGERGVGLSGGQKQRIAIARALLKGPRVLILDEAVSSLDPETAEQFAATIQRLKGQITILFITHQVPRGLVPDAVIRLGGPPTTGGELIVQDVNHA